MSSAFLVFWNVLEASMATRFASILNSSVMLGNYLQKTTSADDIFGRIFFLGALRVKSREENSVYPEQLASQKSAEMDLQNSVYPEQLASQKSAEMNLQNSVYPEQLASQKSAEMNLQNSVYPERLASQKSAEMDLQNSVYPEQLASQKSAEMDLQFFQTGYIQVRHRNGKKRAYK